MKKYFAVMLTVVLLMSLAEGCGSSGSGDQTAGTEATETGAAQSSAADTSSGSEAEAEETPEVKAFNIYSIGEDFKNRVQDFYPGYEAAGENSGMIGDVPVVWHIYTDASEYRDVLDEKLESGTDQDEGVDLFVVEETYLRDYVESAASMDVIGEVGLTQEDLSDQFLYTQQMATDADGKLKAVSWQAAPGVFAYRRSIAREVLGTDDPEKVQEAVADWEAFADTAEAVKEAGYYMLSGYEDAYRVYADNVTSAWVENGALNIDPHLEDWAVQTREFAEKGYTHGTEQWDTRTGQSSGVTNGERTIQVTERFLVSSTLVGEFITHFRPRRKAGRTMRRALQETMRFAEVLSPAITADSGSLRRKTAETLSLPVRS